MVFRGQGLSGLSIKDVSSQGERGWSSADIFQQERDFRCGRPQFLVQKTSDFFKFMECLHWQRWGGWVSADICGQGREGSIFRDVVRTSFMGSPLCFYIRNNYKVNNYFYKYFSFLNSERQAKMRIYFYWMQELKNMRLLLF